MSTVYSIVARSLRLLKILDVGEAVEAEDMDTALEALNAMLRRWEASGLAMGWSPQTEPSDDMPTPDEAEEAIVANLAMRLLAEYPSPANVQLIASLAAESYASLLRDREVEMPTRQCTDAPRGYRRGLYNVFSDTIGGQ